MDTKQWATETMEKIVRKLRQTAPQIGASFPHACAENTYDNMHPDWWTNGFWPGMLWMAYRETGDKMFADIATETEDNFAHILDNYYTVDHDAGFLWLLSCGAHHRLTGDETAKLRTMKAAAFLASRFNPVGRFIQAWNREPGWAIIDCTMNLPLLYWASHEDDDNPRMRHIAEMHATTVCEKFVRADGSVNHILSFNPETGELIEPLGGQSSGPDGAWSRGSAWALYGLPLSYRNTKNPLFLETAKKVAEFYLANLPEDSVAHWDFRVPRNTDTPRDTSAAACGACGLLELAEFCDGAEKERYRTAAENILKSLTDNYSNLDNPDKQCLLNCGTGNLPGNSNINVGLIYGDYYYMEGISRLTGQTEVWEYVIERA